jgi:chemotaxis protein CheC
MDAKLDFLQELGNIGTGHATTALSSILGNKRLSLVVPRAYMLSFTELAQYLGTSEDIVSCIYVQFQGDLDGHMAFILPIEQATNLANILLQESELELSELGESAILEVGNIMLASYLNALGSLTNLRLVPTVPVIAIDMIGAVWQSILAGANVADNLTMIDTRFYTHNVELNGHIIVLPSDTAYQTLSRVLNLEDVR